MLSRSQKYGLMLRSKHRYIILWRSDEVPCHLVCWGGLGRTHESFRPRTGARCHWLVNVNGEHRSEFCCNLLALICELCRGAGLLTRRLPRDTCSVQLAAWIPNLSISTIFLELKATPCSSVWCNIFTVFWRSVRTFWPQALHLRCFTRLFSFRSAYRNLFSRGRIHLFRCLS